MATANVASANVIKVMNVIVNDLRKIAMAFTAAINQAIPAIELERVRNDTAALYDWEQC